MGGSVNKHILVGNVGKDPEIIQSNGKKVARFSLATTRSWRDKESADRNEVTNWHNIVVFDERLVDVIEQYVKKGHRLYIEGSVETRKWQDRDGNDRYSTETVLRPFMSALKMLTSRGRSAPSEDDYGEPTSGDGAPPPSLRDELDDDIPF